MPNGGHTLAGWSQLMLVLEIYNVGQRIGRGGSYQAGLIPTRKTLEADLGFSM